MRNYSTGKVDKTKANIPGVCGLGKQMTLMFEYRERERKEGPECEKLV